jgi:uncharacterized damage-inducible protein DinB
MTRMMDSMMGEVQQEAATTRRVLERVPADKLAWKPHPKSMTLGQLAMHVATIPGGICKMALADEFEVDPSNFNQPGPSNAEQILTAFDESIRTAHSYLGEMSDSSAQGSWRLTVQGREVMAMPRAGLLRSIMLNHWYHHRGQLSVYLRLLDVPVPVIYGPSADENPFA